MYFTPSFIVIFFNSIHCKNAPVPTFSQVEGTITDSNFLQFRKACLAIPVNPFGSCISFKEIQLVKASSPIIFKFPALLNTTDVR